MNKLDGYNKDITEFLQISRFNVEDVLYKLPAKKHYYVALLISHKGELKKLENLYDDALEQETEKIVQSSDVIVPKNLAEQKAKQTDIIKKIKRAIQDEHLTIEYLERVEKILSSTTYDLGNIAKLLALETT